MIKGNQISDSLKENYIYLLKDGKILKLLVTIDSYIIKKNLIKLISNLDENHFEMVSPKAFKILNLCVDDYKIFNNRKRIRVPAKSSPDSDLIYLLNKIYNNKKYNIKMFEQDDIYYLNNEYQYYLEFEQKNSKIWISVIEDVVSNLNIEILEEYDYSKLSESLDYIEYVRNREKSYDMVNLKQLKNILLSSSGNKDIFESLNINVITKSEKEKIKIESEKHN